jgi:hypothetical protein
MVMMLAWFVIAFLGIVVLLRFQEGTPMGILRGNTVLNIWLPTVEGFAPESVTIGGDGISVAPYKATRGLREPRSSTYHTRLLTLEEWEALRQLRKEWCRNAPVFATIPDGAPFYYVAFQCDAAIDGEVKIPVGAMPSVIQTIIDSLLAVRVPNT